MLKKRVRIFFGIFFVIFCLMATQGFGEEVEYQDPDGVKVKFDESGEIKSIIASGEETLLFGDRKDIQKSKKKAKMRAKAEIAKFLTEKINKEETIDDMAKTIVEQQGGGDGSSTSAKRKSIEIQTEKIQNSAEALLKGVMTLLEDVNRDEKYVRIEVGINKKTMKAADTMKGLLKKDLSEPNNSQETSGTVKETGRTVKKSKMYDDF